jgi:serine/threonine-protein kinase RsbW
MLQPEMPHEDRWHRVFSGCVSEVPVATHWVASIAADLNLPEPLAFDMQVCLEELMSNIVLHGAKGSAKDPAETLSIAITLEALPERLVMTVEDNGRPFDVAKAPARPIDRPLEQVQPGGLGIQLIKNFTNSLAYSRTESGNRVIVTFER